MVQEYKDEIKQLLGEIGNLAGNFRNAGSIQEQNGVVEKYHEVIHQLYDLGWDDALDVDAELPDDFLPKIYLERAPLSFQKHRNNPLKDNRLDEG